MMFDCLVDRLVDLDVHCWCSGLRDRGGRLDSSWTKSKQDQSIFFNFLFEQRSAQRKSYPPYGTAWCVSLNRYNHV
jgi:hypothetical protein